MGRIRKCKDCGSAIGYRMSYGKSLAKEAAKAPRLKRIYDWGSNYCKKCGDKRFKKRC